MGWRDRDYAKWTDEERGRFYGAAGSRHGSSLSSRVGVVPSAFVAVVVSLLVALALGQLPRSHPLIPALHFALPAIGSRTVKPGTISLPSSVQVGSFLTLHGQLPASETGTVTVEGAYERSPMRVLARVPVQGGSYEARIRLAKRGRLRLRVTYPDGHRSVGETRVARG